MELVAAKGRQQMAESAEQSSDWMKSPKGVADVTELQGNLGW
jgi:hypothetical protein